MASFGDALKRNAGVPKPGRRSWAIFLDPAGYQPMLIPTVAAWPS